jgi:hypothetical protein
VGVRIGGIATLLVDGTQYALRGDMRVQPSPTRREGVAGQDYVHGFTEMPVVPEIVGNFSTIPGLSVNDIDAMTNVTVQADLANGSSYILSQAWTESAKEIDTVRGQLEIRWQGIYCDEILS